MKSAGRKWNGFCWATTEGFWRALLEPLGNWRSAKKSNSKSRAGRDVGSFVKRRIVSLELQSPFIRDMEEWVKKQDLMDMNLVSSKKKQKKKTFCRFTSLPSKTSGWWRSAFFYTFEAINKLHMSSPTSQARLWNVTKLKETQMRNVQDDPAWTMHVYERNRSQMWTRSAGSPVHMVPAKHNIKMEGWQIWARPHLERSQNLWSS